jgi:hypothetical protein
MLGLPRRPVLRLRNRPEASRYAVWHDTLGLDSVYDYDPVWAKCVELGISPTFHSARQALVCGLRFQFCLQPHRSLWASGNIASPVVGGVTKRSTLKFGFLEGGVGWACSLTI